MYIRVYLAPNSGEGERLLNLNHVLWIDPILGGDGCRVQMVEGSFDLAEAYTELEDRIFDLEG